MPGGNPAGIKIIFDSYSGHKVIYLKGSDRKFSFKQR